MTEKDKKKVWDTLDAKLGLWDGNFSDDSSLKDDMYVDSLDAVEITMDLENKFNVVIPDEDIESINTVKDIYDVIDKLRSHGKAQD